MTDLAKIPLSQMRVAGPFRFLSGQLGFVSPGVLAEGGIEGQTRQAIANITSLLEAEGLSLNHVVKSTVWLTDAANFADFNAVYAAAFGTPYPARSTVVSSLVVPGALVEIEVIAYAG